MPKHLKRITKDNKLRHLGIRWTPRGNRLLHSFTTDKPRLACIAKRFANRGLEIDPISGALSIEKPARRTVRLSVPVVTFLALAICAAGALTLQGEAKSSTNRGECVFVSGESMPGVANTLTRVEMGGLSVLRVNCLKSRYRVTIDSKGLVVEARPS